MKMRILGLLLMAGTALAQTPAAQTALAQTPATQTAPAQAPATQAPTPQAVGTMSELMVDIIYPLSDAFFYISTRAPKNDEEWSALQGKALMLAESANLLMMPGRARDQDRWMHDSKLLLDVGAAVYKAAKAKDVDALVALTDPQLLASCTTCHRNYRAAYGRRRP